MKTAFLIVLHVAIYFSVAMFIVWCLACWIGSASSARQRRRQLMRKARDHRVGGVISP
jgi:hypothetical protein